MELLNAFIETLTFMIGFPIMLIILGGLIYILVRVIDNLWYTLFGNTRNHDKAS